MGNEIGKHLVGLDTLRQQGSTLRMVIGKECRTNEHEQCPDGYRHQHTDIGGLLGLMVVLGSQVALDDGLVGAIFLQGIEDTVEHHD